MSATIRLLGIVGLVSAVLAGCGSGPAEPSGRDGVQDAPSAEAAFVGRGRCQQCHAEQDRLWTGSHHDLAMQPATRETVLGNFRNTSFTYAGVTSRFLERNGTFVVRTDGPDGRVADFEVAYVFGVFPLQQYLVAFPDGRYQALGLAWDSRPRAAGGQRWFHLYPNEGVTHRDVLHWTKFSQNWNAQCAACHSTNLQKRYDPQRDAYRTTWSELDVSCEACHGPGSAHVAWAEAARSRGDVPKAGARAAGLTVDLSERRGVRWNIRPETGLAVRSRAPEPVRREVEVCAPCHSRRTELTDAQAPGARFLDGYAPELLVQGLYHANGQVQDEVYTYGSFAQSRMHAAGVTCSDCHEPHSLELRASGNDVCAPCHLASTFDTPGHHFHRAGSAGASCVACHMPAETFMVVDRRHDHAFSIPRPDHTQRYGVPNACTACHTGKDAAWAAAALDRHRRTPWRDRPHFTRTLHAARQGAPAAGEALMALAARATEPAIVRATAVSLLGTATTPHMLPALQRWSADADPLVRLAVARALQGLQPSDRARVGSLLLKDPARAVRQESAAALAGDAEAFVTPGDQDAFRAALAEYEASLRANADRPDARMSAALLHQRRGQIDRARAEYESAIAHAPWFTPAYVNLADLLRAGGREAAAEATLRKALTVAPDDPGVLYALGLSLVRQGRRGEALQLFARAAAASPDAPHLALAHALALESAGHDAEAVRVVRRGLSRRPHDRDLLELALMLSRRQGALDEARTHVRRLLEIAPSDPAVQALARELGVRN